MYPQWITRAPGIGPVLVQNEKEKNQLLEDWEVEQLEVAEKEAAEAKAVALAAKADAEESVKLALKAKNGK